MVNLQRIAAMMGYRGGSEDMCGSYRVMWRGYGMSKEGYGARWRFKGELHENIQVREILFLYCYAFSVSLLLTPLCCDDIHDVTPRVSALAGCDRLVSEPLVIEKSYLLMKANRISSDPDRTWVDGIRCATQIMRIVVAVGSCYGNLAVLLSVVFLSLSSFVYGYCLRTILLYQESFQFRPGDLIGFFYSNRLDPPGQSFLIQSWDFYHLHIDAACAFRAEEMPSLISCWMAAKVMADVSDVDVLLGGILST
ncbi:hypothetical protein Tco_0034403 [Tanacetum coccineum]